jgi:hypothetical protein
MKNKNNEAIIKHYTTVTGEIYKQLNALKELMEQPDYSEAVDYDNEVNDGDNCMNGDFSCFIQDLAEGWARE